MEEIQGRRCNTAQQNIDTKEHLGRNVRVSAKMITQKQEGRGSRAPANLAPSEKHSERCDFRFFTTIIGCDGAIFSVRWHHMAHSGKKARVRTHVHQTYGTPGSWFATRWTGLKSGSIFGHHLHIYGGLNFLRLG